MGVGCYFGSMLVLALLFRPMASQEPNTDGFFVAEFLKNMRLTSSPLYNYSAPVCSWRGVLCDDGRLVKFSASGLGLSGLIPDTTIGKLSMLQVLDLGNNKITALPSDFWSLGSLKETNLSGNQISGVLANNIGNFAALEMLDLSGNNFSSEIPSALSSLTNLRILSLGDNGFEGSSPDGIVNCHLLGTQGLAEGDYCHLSVEERLNALVVLVGVANEGNTDRLEAANALKKQMLSETQLDRSRLKKDFMTKLDFTPSAGSKFELQFGNSSVEAVQRASPFVDINKEASPSTGVNQKSLFSAQDIQNLPDDLSVERTMASQEASMNPDNVLTQHSRFASIRCRSQLKAYIGHRAEEVYVYRSLPLGQDRRRNRYWQFVASASANDPRPGRIFVELHNGLWRVIDSLEAFDALLSSLDPRGIRESHLRIVLRKIEATFKENLKRIVRSEATGFPGDDSSAETDSSSSHLAGNDSPSSMVCGPSSNASVPSSLFRVQL